MWNKTLSARQAAHHRRGEKTSYKQTDQALTERKRGRDLAFPHRTTTRLVREHDVIATEDLNVRGMTASARGRVEESGSEVHARVGAYRAPHSSEWGKSSPQCSVRWPRTGKLC